jgi:DNA (cytosine-5)-methyltransferase 1
MITFASLFTGYGGADLGAIQAGLTPVWGGEKDPDISYVANLNHGNYISCLDAKDCNFSLLQRPGWLHASPPCTTATVVNDKKESQEDIELAQATCRAIEVLQPQYFSLENVAGYVRYQSFAKIVSRLYDLNYAWDYKVLDCSDYGVPQARKRLFFVASKNPSVFGWVDRIPKVEEKANWYDAIADLIPTLPECKLKESQKTALVNSHEVLTNSIEKSEYFRQLPNLAIQNSGSRKDKDGNPTNTIRLANETIWTIRAMSGKVRVNPHQVTLIVDGRVLRPTIECYARWQSFHNSYQFSGDFKLDMRGVGNAVPPLMFSQIVRSVLNDFCKTY